MLFQRIRQSCVEDGRGSAGGSSVTIWLPNRRADVEFSHPICRHVESLCRGGGSLQD